MKRTFCRAKIHRATVTEADLDYVGSISIDRDLLEATGMMPYEMVQITNVANGKIWHTYIIPAEAGSGEICLNGPPARHFQVGDEVIILSKVHMEKEKIEDLTPTVIFLDEENNITDTKEADLAALA